MFSRWSPQAVTSATLAFGGVMEGDAVGSHAVRASGTEKFLVGKQLTNDVLQEALATLKKELVCTGAVKSEYRHRLVTGFFFKFFVAAADGALGGAGEEKKSGSSAVGRAVASAGVKFVRPVSTGKQEYKYPDEHAPVSQPTAKYGMDLQCSGQAECTLQAARCDSSSFPSVSCSCRCGRRKARGGHRVRRVGALHHRRRQDHGHRRRRGREGARLHSPHHRQGESLCFRATLGTSSSVLPVLALKAFLVFALPAHSRVEFTSCPLSVVLFTGHSRKEHDVNHGPRSLD
jgi:hypothetical protein